MSKYKIQYETQYEQNGGGIIKIHNDASSKTKLVGGGIINIKNSTLDITNELSDNMLCVINNLIEDQFVNININGTNYKITKVYEKYYIINDNSQLYTFEGKLPNNTHQLNLYTYKCVILLKTYDRTPSSMPNPPKESIVYNDVYLQMEEYDILYHAITDKDNLYMKYPVWLVDPTTRRLIDGNRFQYKSYKELIEIISDDMKIKIGGALVTCKINTSVYPFAIYELKYNNKSLTVPSTDINRYDYFLAIVDYPESAQSLNPKKVFSQPIIKYDYNKLGISLNKIERDTGILEENLLKLSYIMTLYFIPIIKEIKENYLQYVGTGDLDKTEEQYYSDNDNKLLKLYFEHSINLIISEVSEKYLLIRLSKLTIPQCIRIMASMDNPLYNIYLNTELNRRYRNWNIKNSINISNYFKEKITDTYTFENLFTDIFLNLNINVRTGVSKIDSIPFETMLHPTFLIDEYFLIILTIDNKTIVVYVNRNFDNNSYILNFNYGIKLQQQLNRDKFFMTIKEIYQTDNSGHIEAVVCLPLKFHFDNIHLNQKPIIEALKRQPLINASGGLSYFDPIFNI